MYLILISVIVLQLPASGNKSLDEFGEANRKMYMHISNGRGWSNLYDKFF